MAFNLSALMTGASAVASHPLTKGGSLAALITGGLYAASAAGIAIPGLAFTLGPLAGYIVYRFLPAKDQAAVDSVAQKVTDVVNDIQDVKTYPEYPVNKDAPIGAPNNLTTGGS